MAIYNYKGIDRKGTEKSGTVNAEGIAQAKQKVRAQGIMLTSIKEQKSKSGGGGGGSAGGGGGGGGSGGGLSAQAAAPKPSIRLRQTARK